MRVTEVPGLRGRGVVHDGGVRQQAAELPVAEPQPVRLAPQHRGLEVPARRQLQELAAEHGVEGVLIVRPEVVVMRLDEATEAPRAVRLAPALQVHPTHAGLEVVDYGKPLCWGRVCPYV